MVKPSYEINNESLSKMEFIKVNNKWVSKEEKQVYLYLRSNRDISDQAEPNVGDQVEQGVGGQDSGANDEVGPSAGVVEDYVINALVGYELPIDHGIPMSQFERLMISRLGNIASDQRNHYEFFAARF